MRLLRNVLCFSLHSKLLRNVLAMQAENIAHMTAKLSAINSCHSIERTIVGSCCRNTAAATHLSAIDSSGRNLMSCHATVTASFVQCPLLYPPVQQSPPRPCRRPLMLSARPASSKQDSLGRRAGKLALLATCAAMLWLGGGDMATATTGMGMDVDLTGEVPSDLGTTAGRQFLHLCSSRQCLSSSEKVGSPNYVAPWTFNDNGKETVGQPEAMAELLETLQVLEGVTVVKQEDDYVWCEARRGLALVDDVEFFFSPNRRDLEIRSSSRVPFPPDRNAQRLDKLLVELSSKYRKADGTPRWHPQDKKCAIFLYSNIGEFEFCDSPDSKVFSLPPATPQVIQSTP
jgi:uncharacterized protein (DUF1499 family)